MLLRVIKHNNNPPPCLQAPLECTDVEKLFLEESVILFKGTPPPRPAYTRNSRRPFFDSFFDVGKASPQAPKREPWRP